MPEFSRAELAYFETPRRWIPDIVARFGDGPEVRDRIMRFDCDGGFGWLRWTKKTRSWELTAFGRTRGFAAADPSPDRRKYGQQMLRIGSQWQLDVAIPEGPLVARELEEARRRWYRSLARLAAKIARGWDPDADVDDEDDEPLEAAEEDGDGEQQE